MMEKYHKIETLLVRDKTTFKVIEGEWRLPEFDYLKDLKWMFTEKIDGTNMRVEWSPYCSGTPLRFGGRTDNAQIPVFLLNKLQDIFQVGNLSVLYPELHFVLYGEGFGAQIQKGGGNYISDGVDFILFDVAVALEDGWVWLTRESVEDIGAKLGVYVVPIVGTGTLSEAVAEVKAGVTSTFGNFPAEGYVVRPKVELQTRTGHRLIGKIKTGDF